MMRSVAALLALGLASCKPPEQPRPAGNYGPRPRVTAAVAAAKDIEYAVEAPGSLEAAEEISIPARLSGTLDRVNFQEGDRVTEATLLAEIELDLHRLGEELAAAEVQRAAAGAELAATVYQNRLALQEEGRKQKKEWVTAEQMATWKADLDRSRAELARARVQLELARKAHRDARLHPPIAGIINRKLVSKGEYVKPETVVATMLNISSLHLRFTVTELEASRLRTGQEASFTLQSAPGRSFKARIFHLGQKADAFTRSVEAKALVEGQDDSFRAGLYASVRVVTERLRSVIVPERAVVPSQLGFSVHVLDADGLVSTRPVKLGLRVPGGVEIVEGVAAGERVAVDGAPVLRNGMTVDVAGEAP
jgi:membrane fusion protein (multidrug efflux system)